MKLIKKNWRGQTWVNTEDIIYIIHEMASPDRMGDLIYILNNQKKLSIEAYHKGLKEAWIYGTNNSNWKFDLAFENADKALLMSKEEIEYYNNLPDMVTLYRGCSKKEINNNDYLQRVGFSWTPKRDVAEFFAFRYFQTDTAVYSITVPKEDVKAIFLERNECEAVITNVNKKEITMVTDTKTEYFEQHRKEAEKRYYALSKKISEELTKELSEELNN